MDDSTECWLFGGEREARHQLQKRSDHALVDDDERRLATGRTKTLETPGDSRAKLRARLPFRKLEAGSLCKPFRIEHWIGDRNFLGRQSLPTPEIDLAKVGLELDRVIRSHYPRRLPGAAERARPDRLIGLAPDMSPRRSNLLASQIRKRDIGHTVVPDTRLPRSLAMSNEDQTAQSVAMSQHAEILAPGPRGVNAGRARSQLRENDRLGDPPPTKAFIESIRL